MKATTRELPDGATELRLYGRRLDVVPMATRLGVLCDLAGSETQVEFRVNRVRPSYAVAVVVARDGVA